MLLVTAITASLVGSTVLIFADSADADRDSIKKKIAEKKVEAKKRISEARGGGHGPGGDPPSNVPSP